MQTLLSLGFLTLVISALAVLILVKAIRAWQTGRIGTPLAQFDRQQHNSQFLLAIGFYLFGSASFFFWALIMVGMMGLYSLEMLLK